LLVKYFTVSTCEFSARVQLVIAGPSGRAV